MFSNVTFIYYKYLFILPIDIIYIHKINALAFKHITQ